MSLCIRCGKERIVISTKKEKVGNSVITYTKTICSDPKCQAMVENTLNNEKIKRSNLMIEKEKQALQRLKAKKSLA